MELPPMGGPASLSQVTVTFWILSLAQGRPATAPSSGIHTHEPSRVEADRKVQSFKPNPNSLIAFLGLFQKIWIVFMTFILWLVLLT